ncbi:MAG: hypothetical protein DYG88_14910 [Chloroflexi bacterium CFX4]|nr:hypothetical protein [Chloroflexi bacterium CFX4]
MGEVSYEAVRRRVVQHLRKRALFWLHLAFFIVACAYFNGWSSAAGLTQASYDRFQIMLVVWFGAMVGHGIFALDLWQRAVDRMVQRELRKSGVVAKRKHNLVGLGDDGELVPLDELTDIEDEAAQPKRRERH